MYKGKVQLTCKEELSTGLSSQEQGEVIYLQSMTHYTSERKCNHFNSTLC